MPKKKRVYTHTEEYLRKHAKKPSPEAQTASVADKLGPRTPKVVYIPGTNVIDRHPSVQATHVPAHHRIRPFHHLSLASEVKKQESKQ